MYLQSLAKYTFQYFIVLSGFASFVMWNGGVVLGKYALSSSQRSLTISGDKSNHIATLHLPQMLYIWPYFAFFSFPILIPIAMAAAIKSRPVNLITIWNKAPRLWVISIFLIVSTIVVHFNTIIHPFSLADNRHYIFYVFKILRRSWMNKYLAIPVYVGCGSLVIDALHQPKLLPVSTETTPINTRQIDATTDELQERDCRIGFSIVWLATSTLCLVTAPLVEPRYFIVPWVIWRLQVGSQYLKIDPNPPQNHPTRNPNLKESVWARMRQPSTWLWLETLWFLLVNAITCYLFLQRTFEWPQEPGRKQRFMW
jgi:alpha-1,2-glucosyltransferase